jgi:hypothetical protein
MATSKTVKNVVVTVNASSRMRIEYIAVPLPHSISRIFFSIPHHALQARAGPQQPVGYGSTDCGVNFDGQRFLADVLAARLLVVL